MFSPPSLFRYNLGMDVLIIAGPTSTPLDEAREISNRSTGRTGILMAEALGSANVSTHLWLGRGVTHPIPLKMKPEAYFHTLQDLQLLIEQVDLSRYDSILLAAALPDYQLHQATTPDGKAVTQRKWPSSLPILKLELRPCPKILPALRQKAPDSKIIGWKWEASSTRSEAEEAARGQIQACQTDACVLNGPSYGSGYLLILAEGLTHACSDPTELGNAIARFLGT
jgi:phosphopantothenoylcysteine decarboxylase/phosphopantothenate--cysteine ligase